MGAQLILEKHHNHHVGLLCRQHITSEEVYANLLNYCAFFIVFGHLWTAHSLKIRALFGHLNIYTKLYLPMLPADAGIYAAYLNFSAFKILSSMYYFQPHSAKVGVILMRIQR